MGGFSSARANGGPHGEAVGKAGKSGRGADRGALKRLWKETVGPNAGYGDGPLARTTLLQHHAVQLTRR
jgi:hypothetical protein